jgi:hypothetical protein
MYNFGDKIIDVRNGNVDYVISIDEYEDVTLVFTETKKYIPINFVISFNDRMDYAVNSFIKKMLDGMEKDPIKRAEILGINKVEKPIKLTFLEKVFRYIKNIFSL